MLPKTFTLCSDWYRQYVTIYPFGIQAKYHSEDKIDNILILEYNVPIVTWTLDNEE